MSRTWIHLVLVCGQVTYPLDLVRTRLAYDTEANGERRHSSALASTSG